MKLDHLKKDFKTLYHLALAPRRGKTHAERMENFYRGQASHYDDFRERLLQGRRELLATLYWPELAHGTWVDFGAGTGANVQFVDDKRTSLEKIYLIDLSPSLLDVARERIEKNGWTNVEAVLSDA